MAQSPNLLPHEILANNRESVLEISRQHNMFEVRIFGSTQRLDDTITSDIDFLVTPPPRCTLFSLSRYSLELEQLLGVPVDIVTTTGLRPGHPILETAQPL